MKFYWLVTEKTPVTDGRKDGRTDGRKDGRTDNAISISPSLFHRRGIKISRFVLLRCTLLTNKKQTRFTISCNSKGLFWLVYNILNECIECFEPNILCQHRVFNMIINKISRGPWNAHLRQKVFKSSLFSLLYVQQAIPGRSKSEGYSFKM